MAQQFLLVKARNTITNQTVKQQDLTGQRLGLHQRAIARELADRLAQNLTERTRENWVGEVELYTPSKKNITA